MLNMISRQADLEGISGRGTFNRCRGFRSDRAAYGKQRLPNPSRRHLGTVGKVLVSDRSHLFVVYRDNNWERYAGM